MTLNDATFAECAAALGKKMADSASTVEEQIRWGFMSVTCREPLPAELDELVELHRIYSKDEHEAAYQAVASVLLNLDEVVTK